MTEIEQGIQENKEGNKKDSLTLTHKTQPQVLKLTGLENVFVL